MNDVDRTLAPPDPGQSLTELAWRLVSGGAWAFSGKLITAGSGAAISILLARLLPPSAVGAYFLGLSVVTATSILARAGLEKTVLQLVAESLARGEEARARAAVRQIYLIAAMTVAIVALGLWAGGARWIATELFDSGTLATIAKLLPPWMVFLTFEMLLAETFRGFDDIPKASIFGGALSRAACVVVFSALLVFHGASNLGSIVLLTLGCYVLSLILGGYGLRRRVTGLRAGVSHFVPASFVLRSTWPLLVTNLTVFAMGQAGVWILGAFRPDEEVALFGVCVRLVMLVGVSLTIAAAVLPPVIGQLYVQEEKKKLERVMRTAASVAAVPSVIILTAFIVAGRPILELAFGAFYAAGAGALALLSLGQIVNVWVGSCGYALIMTGHQRDLMISTILAGTVTVAGGLAVVQHWGVAGVATATAAGTIVNQILMLSLARIRCGIWTHASPFLLRDPVQFVSRLVLRRLASDSEK